MPTVAEVAERLRRKEEPEPDTKQVNVRLEWEDWLLLKGMSVQTGFTPSTIAGQLLVAAISEAATQMGIGLDQVGFREFIVTQDGEPFLGAMGEEA